MRKRESERRSMLASGRDRYQQNCSIEGSGDLSCDLRCNFLGPFAQVIGPEQWLQLKGDPGLDVGDRRGEREEEKSCKVNPETGLLVSARARSPRGPECERKRCS